MKYNFILAAGLLCLTSVSYGQVTSATIKQANLASANPTNAELFAPIPNVVTPAKTCGNAPSDAIILFDGKNLDEWQSPKDQSAAKWTVANGILTVDKTVGDIETKRKFGSFQLHIEWKIPADITGTGQARGNSGIFLSGKYEIRYWTPTTTKIKPTLMAWPAVYTANLSP
ncbi:3-keto-disaccharide hydrolase [Mucilaginibacter humi]|uniref:3-keto-disaccharide hydrolase n=1 Tax=Mucilaginibacter humi TaxID=2732510 RepID=UPI0021D21C39|nr:DUF1080 domain-containing protein [Mucilaginibacter humi]